MADISYSLVSSAIRIRGRKVTTLEKYGPPEGSTIVEDLQVELVHRADDASASRSIAVGGQRGDTDLSLALTADGRLQSFDYKSTGIGGAVVAASAKVLAFVATIAASAARVGGLAGQSDQQTAPAPLPDARAEWARQHPDQHSQLEASKALAKEATQKLSEVRGRIVAGDPAEKLAALLAREGALSAMLQTLDAEIGRIEDLYGVWIERQRVTSSAAIERFVAVERIPRRQGDGTPDATTLDAELYAIWDELGVQLEIVDARPSLDLPFVSSDRDGSYVEWRSPRPAELWVWKRTPTGEPDLVSRASVRIVDRYSALHRSEMRTSAFGQHGGTLTFNDDGSPATLKLHHESGAGAFANAFGGVPSAVVEAVDQAKELGDAWNGIQGAAAERAKSAAERDLATARARLELVGLHATADDFAALKRAEQAAKLLTATSSISPAAEALDNLKLQLEMVSTQNKLDEQRRASILDAHLAALRAEVAQLDLEVKAAKAQFELASPRVEAGR